MNSNKFEVATTDKSKMFQSKDQSRICYFEDEGRIGYFESEEDMKKMADFFQKLNKLTNQHLKKR